ncbi:MAG: tRNA pseudouridine(13) synthase TruD [Pseudomonadota bacterium]
MPATRCVLRATPEDFVVDEDLGLEPDGIGEHLLLRVEKTGANTSWVARQLARWAQIPPADVSFSGMKDRHAVARQWFSLRLGGREDPPLSELAIDGVQVLSSARHGRKLRRGTHCANHFSLTLRELDADLTDRFTTLVAHGFPNYFGAQRYGQRNLQSAQTLFSGKGRRLKREQRSMAISAARSLLFDEVLARRVAHGTWNRLLAGDAAMLAGSQSWFAVDAIDDALVERLRRFDIHPSGPLWGTGEPVTGAGVAQLEQVVAQEHEGFATGLASSGSRQQRRSLRACPSGARIEQHERTALLRFTLPPGSYATSLVRELADIDEPDRARERTRTEPGDRR